MFKQILFKLHDKKFMYILMCILVNNCYNYYDLNLLYIKKCFQYQETMQWGDC